MLSPNRVNIPRTFIPIVALLTALGPLSIDIYLPAIPTMQVFFGAQIEALNLSIAVFLLGTAIGQLLGGPLSDQVGRKPIGLIGLFIFILATSAVMFVVSITQLIQWRFLQAIGSGLATGICMGAVRDAYEPKEAGRKMPIVMMITMLAPLVSPALGAALLKLGWLAIFAFLATYAVLLFALLGYKLPETNTQISRKVSLNEMFRQYKTVLSHRSNRRLVALPYAVVMAIASAPLLIFITSASFVYMEYFGISANLFPVFFGVNVIGLMIANFVSLHLMKTQALYTMMGAGLLMQCVFSVLLVAVAWFGQPSIWLVCPLIVLTIAMGGVINPNGMAIYMSFFPHQGGSASSVSSTLMFAFGGALGGLAITLHDGSLMPVFVVMLGATLTAFIGYQLLPTIELEDDAVIPIDTREVESLECQ